MMEMLLIREGLNGQLVIDFDSLEAMTSIEFVNFVKSRTIMESIKNVSISFDSENYLILDVITTVFVFRFQFNKKANTFIILLNGYLNDLKELYQLYIEEVIK
jgi:hypothetical protein